MNKSDLAKAMSAIAGLTRQDAERAIDALIATVMKEVKEGRKVSLMGFGSFVPTRRAARVGRNPRTGAAVRIAASSGVRFASGSLFKSVLNKGGKIPMPTAKAPAKKAPAEKAPAKKAVVKKAAVKKAPAKKAAVKKAAVKKAPAKKAAVKKAAVKKAPAKKAAVKKAPAKKAAVKKAPAKKAAVKKAAVKKTGSR